MLIPYGDDIEKRHPPFATIFLMAVNVLVYMYEARLLNDEPQTGFYLREFVERWGLVPQQLAHGKVVGLLSAQFLHADLAHLIGNLFTMWLFAWTIELALGSFSYLILYLTWGIAAGLLHASMNWESKIPCVGASGAIFGIIGAYVVTFGIAAQVKCLWNGGILTGWKFVKFEMPAGVYVFGWLLLPQLISMMLIDPADEMQGGVAWYAHAGGFGAGALCMIVFGRDAMRRLRMNREGKWEIQGAVDEPDAAEGSQDTVVEDTAAEERPAPKGPACQYCGTPFADANKIDNTLYRCPNSECRRLTYVSSNPAPAAPARRW